MKPFEYYQPLTLQEALRLMEKFQGRARYIAGGTDVIVRIKQGVIQPDALISLRGISELKGIEHRDGVAFGSLTLIRELEREPVFTRDYPVLAEAARVLANPQIRNVATIGGNLGNAAPSADCAPPLMVLEAGLTVAGSGGSREIPVADFFQGPGRTCCDASEILTRIRIPQRPSNSGMAFLKMGRVSQDIAVTNVAALVVMEQGVCRKCRLAVGAVAPVPLRLKKIEAVIEGRQISDDLLDRVSRMVEQEVSPITDVRSTEEHRRVVTGVLVKRAIQQALQNVV